MVTPRLPADDHVLLTATLAHNEPYFADAIYIPPHGCAEVRPTTSAAQHPTHIMLLDDVLTTREDADCNAKRTLDDSTLSRSSSLAQFLKTANHTRNVHMTTHGAR